MLRSKGAYIDPDVMGINNQLMQHMQETGKTFKYDVFAFNNKG
jgi:hypothetical protein